MKNKKAYMVIIPFKCIVGVFSTKEKAIQATKNYDDWCNIVEINIDEIDMLRLPSLPNSILKGGK